jgi:hypothetical protein
MKDEFEGVFNEQYLMELFPDSRADDFFEALLGDANDGSYDIRLKYDGYDEKKNALVFCLELIERPGCCLACNLTLGLPGVFSRHPVINIKGLVADIDKKIDGLGKCGDWRLGGTIQKEKSMHCIPLEINLI